MFDFESPYLHKDIANGASWVDDFIATIPLEFHLSKSLALLLQLNNLSKRYKNHKSPHFRRLGQQYQAQHQQLLLYLMDYVSKKDHFLTALLLQDKNLTYLLICQLLRAKAPLSVLKSFLLHLFNELNDDDWVNSALHQSIEKKLFFLSTKCSIDDLKSLLYAYVPRIQQSAQDTHVIWFIDELLEKTQQGELAMYCLHLIHEIEPLFIINFLTHTQSQDLPVKHYCLKKLALNSLVALSGHLLAINPVGADKNKAFLIDFLTLFCEHISTQNNPEVFLRSFAENVQFLPTTEEQFAISNTYIALLTPELKSLWLQSLINQYHHKTNILPLCTLFIQSYPDKLHLITPFLNPLTEVELFTLYSMMKHHAVKKEAYSCFNELFKDIFKQGLFFYLVTNIPNLNPDLLNQSLSYLDDQALLKLINQLLTRVAQQVHYTHNLNQALVIFCQRLYANTNPEALIHQWTKEPFSQNLAYAMLCNPECIVQLTTSYSSLYSWVTWSTCADALSHRMDCLLNHDQLSPEKMHVIAFNSLTYFQAHPHDMQRVFQNLHASEQNRNALGKKNLSNLLQTFWNLTNPHTPYEELAFLNSIETPSVDLFHLVTNQYLTEQIVYSNPAHAAWMLALSSTPIPLEALHEVLICLLMHSAHERLGVNWSKCVAWLDGQSKQKHDAFIERLLTQVISTSDDSSLNQQVITLITQRPVFKTFLLKFNEQHFIWLIKNACKEVLLLKSPDWFDSILKAHEAHSMNLGKMFSHVPKDHLLIAALLKKEALTKPKVIANLFLQLSMEPLHGFFILELHDWMTQQNKDWRNQFLQCTSGRIKVYHLKGVALDVLDTLIKNQLPHLSPRSQEDRECLRSYILLLSSRMQKSPNAPSLNAKQRILHLIKLMMRESIDWGTVITESPAFYPMVKSWLHETTALSFNDTTLNHPFTTLIVSNVTPITNGQLSDDPMVHEWIEYVLANPPCSLSLEGFNQLFRVLPKPNQLRLTEAILQKGLSFSVHDAAIETLAQTLTPKALLALLEHAPNPVLIAKGLFAHAEGLLHITQADLLGLIKRIGTAQDLMMFLNTHQPTIGLRFVHELFKLCKHDTHALTTQFAQWLTHPEVLASVANFAITAEQLVLLDKLFHEKPDYQQSLDDYVHYPHLDISLYKKSYLYHYVYQKMLNTSLDKPSLNQWIVHFSFEETLAIMKSIAPSFLQNELILIRLSYDMDANYEERLKLLSHIELAHVPTPILIRCLNSYAPMMAKSYPLARAVLDTLHQLLIHRRQESDLLTSLETAFITLMIEYAVHNPKHDAEFIQQLLGSPHKNQCIKEAQYALKQLFQQAPTLESCLWTKPEYATILEPFISAIEYPELHYDWICWAAHTQNNTNILIHGLLNWLCALKEPKAPIPNQVHQLFKHLCDKQLLTTLMQKASEEQGRLLPTHHIWLCEQSIPQAKDNLVLLHYITTLSPWNWMENYMKKNAQSDFELLKAAVGNKDYIAQINSSEAHQIRFLETLRTNQYRYAQIMELILKTHNGAIRTLLIVYLLSLPKFLRQIKGSSLLERLGHLECHIPSRLNGLIHRIDIALLNESLICYLSDEARYSILCSLAHFPKLTSAQFQLILKKQAPSEFIAYWLNHYALMPNAYFILAKWMTEAEAHVSSELAKINPIKQEAIIHLILEHLELFNPSLALLYEHNEEHRLTWCAKHYLNGHHHKAYVHYIHQLTQNLIQKNHPFSWETISLLMLLSNKPEFSELAHKTAYLTNAALRHYAQCGDTQLFYTSNHINIEQSAQTLNLNPPTPEHEQSNLGFFSHLLGGANKKTLPQAPKTQHKELPLVSFFTDKARPVSALEYFLMYVKDTDEPIKKLMDDFLGFYAREGCTDVRRKSVHQLSDLLMRPEILRPVREALFTSFLSYPELYDSRISHKLFLFDAKKMIQHFGLKGGAQNYTLVMNICSWVLKKLDPEKHPNLINMAIRASNEAALELAFSEHTGFFSRIIQWIKRCWYCGWTGFFSPNLPIYVAPASKVNKEDALASINFACKSSPSLTERLSVLIPPLDLKSLDELTQILHALSFKARISDELALRKQLHQILERLSSCKQNHDTHENWFKKNQQSIAANRYRLIELMLLTKTPEEVESWLKQHPHSDPSQDIIGEELNTTLPEYYPEMQHEKQPEPTLMNTTSNLINHALNWSGVHSLFGNDKTSSNPPPAPNFSGI